MWAHAKRDGRPAKQYRWHPLFKVEKFGNTGVPCSNAAKTQNR